MKIKSVLGYTIFLFSVSLSFFLIYKLIFESSYWEEEMYMLSISSIITLFLTAYYSYYTSIAPKRSPLEELDAEIYIIKKKIQNKKLLRKLEKLESENENNGDFKS